MSNLRIEEQDVLYSLKTFFNSYGKYVIGFFVVIFGLYLASTVYSNHQNNRIKESAVIYARFSQTLQSKDKLNMLAISTNLQQNFKDSIYTSMALIENAKYAYDNKDYATATSNLSWVISNSKFPDEVDMAKLSISKVYIEQGKLDDAHKVLTSKHSSSFDASFLEALGDLYVVQGDNDKARSSYKEAASKSQGDTQRAQILDFKLGVIGG